MSKSDLVYLIWNLEDDTEEMQEVFAEIESISQNEFFAAAQTGLHAQHKIRIWESDYEEQPLVALTENGKRYTVYRTYASGNGKIELYLRDKTGGGNEK